MTDRGVPLISDTQSRGELGCRRSHRRRGLWGIRGHLRVAHIKANLLTYLAQDLLDDRREWRSGGAARRYVGVLGPWRPSRGCRRARGKQGEAVGRRITARGEPERSGHVADDLCELRRGGVRGRVGNVTSPVLC